MPGRTFLQIPGPTLVPERIVRAMSQPIIDHRGPKFAALVEACLEGLQGVFKTRSGHVILYPGSDYGAGVPVDEVERRLKADAAHQLRALLVVHNETSTGVTSNIAAVRAALNRAEHGALLLVDTVSSLAS